MRWIFVGFFMAGLAQAQAQAQDLSHADMAALTDLLKRPLSERAIIWRCDPTIMRTCSLNGCSENRATVSVQLDFSAGSYERCDAKGCDSHLMTFSSSGIFTAAILPSTSGTFLKVVNDGSEYVEVASTGLSIIHNFGVCEPVP
jgi:hypothetical protein